MWNKALGGSPVQRVPGEPPKAVKLHDDLTLTILGPTPARLEQFIDIWVEEVGEALEKSRLTEVSLGLESMESRYPPDLEDEDDLEILAETSNVADNSPANGSSIAQDFFPR